MTLSMTPGAIERRRYRAAALGGSLAGHAKLRRNNAMVSIDAAYARSAAASDAPRKCCGGCRTPFSICANKECRCHA